MNIDKLWEAAAGAIVVMFRMFFLFGIIVMIVEAWKIFLPVVLIFSILTAFFYVWNRIKEDKEDDS
tara:strand:+ start:993 stop:1190 length:198 start_codon:yes stop_codon:yes gene_type:complete